MLTTVQDLGRWGYQGLGVPVSGPMDAYSHRLANLVLGNDSMAAALEITLMGPELVAAGAVTCAVAGAEIDFVVVGDSVSAYLAFVVPSGGHVGFGAHRGGARLTLAVRGGFDVPVTLGSRSTHLVARMGPFGGRSLRRGDVLRVGSTDRSGSSGSSSPGSPKPLELPLGGGAAARRPGGASQPLYRRRLGTARAGSVHGDAAVESHGLSARRAGAVARR